MLNAFEIIVENYAKSLLPTDEDQPENWNGFPDNWYPKIRTAFHENDEFEAFHSLSMLQFSTMITELLSLKQHELRYSITPHGPFVLKAFKKDNPHDITLMWVVNKAKHFFAKWHFYER
jgi:hypothetical protein